MWTHGWSHLTSITVPIRIGNLTSVSKWSISGKSVHIPETVITMTCLYRISRLFYTCDTYICYKYVSYFARLLKLPLQTHRELLQGPAAWCCRAVQVSEMTNNKSLKPSVDSRDVHIEQCSPRNWSYWSVGDISVINSPIESPVASITLTSDIPWPSWMPPSSVM